MTSNHNFNVTIKTNFWNYSTTTSAPSQEAAIAQAMVTALHENHSVPTIKVKEVVAVKLDNSGAKVVLSDEVREAIVFNQAY